MSFSRTTSFHGPPKNKVLSPDPLLKASTLDVANVVIETSWICNILLELRCRTSNASIFYFDNVRVVHMSSNLAQHQRTKHFEIDIHFVCDKVSLGHIHILYIPSPNQYGDIFTKGLPTILFMNFRSSMNSLQSSLDKTM